MAGSLKVLLGDETTCVRERLAEALQSIPGVHIAGQAQSAGDCLRLLEMEKPNLVILDIALAGKNSFALISDLRTSAPRLWVAVLIYDNLEVLRRHCYEAGANFCIYAPAEVDTLLCICRALRKKTPPTTKPGFGRALKAPGERGSPVQARLKSQL